MTGRRTHLIIAGVPKAGTTALFEYLAQHPEVYPSRVRETDFFKESGRDLADYEEQFRGATSQRYLLESTPGYVAGGQVIAERVQAALGRPRILVSLRDPVDRFVSHYRMKVRSGAYGDATPSLDAFVEQALSPDASGPPANALRAGAYADRVSTWLDVFEQDMHVVFFDDLRHDVRTVVLDVCGWLDLDTEPVATFDLSPRNSGVRFRSRAVASAAQRLSHRLRPVFQRHPGMRGPLRSAHRRLNGADPDLPADVDAAAACARLAAHYADGNARLAHVLRQAGHDDLPAWLDTGRAPAPSRP